jgi:hypothetical protein
MRRGAKNACKSPRFHKEMGDKRRKERYNNYVCYNGLK